MDVVPFYFIAIIMCLPGLHSMKYAMIQDNSLDVNHVLYGDITKMDDMFISPADYEGPDSIETYENKSRITQKDRVMKASEIEFKSIVQDLTTYPVNGTGFEIDDFNSITKILNNVTRRFEYDDPQDYYTYKELVKKKELINAGLQFLIHTRYKLMGAIQQKEPIKSTKRYRLGYLFNRLRRIQYEMSKIIDQASKQKSYKEAKSVFAFYDQIIRYHVDAKDTIQFIKVIDNEIDDELLAEVSTKQPLEEDTEY